MDNSLKIIDIQNIANTLSGLCNTPPGSNDYGVLDPGENKKTVVFTNGCFDIIHKGHVDYLQKARALGDALCVGLNSDASVKLIKGDLRPIVPQNERAFVLAGMACVDFVVLFDEPDPYNLIMQVKPDILVKGSDWSKDKVIGADFVESYGGRVELMPLVEGASTTNIVKTVLERYCKC